MTKETPRQQADQLLSRLLKGKEVYELFSNSLRNQLQISGHTMKYWEEKFKIKIQTDNLNPATCIQLDIKLMELSQEASFFLAAAQAKAQMLKRGQEASYNDKFHAILQEYKNKGGKVPAAATLETLAKIDNEDINSAEAIAQVELKFWKEVLDHLNTCRKLLENATLNISVEMKANAQERYLDNVARKSNNE